MRKMSLTPPWASAGCGQRCGGCTFRGGASHREERWAEQEEATPCSAGSDPRLRDAAERRRWEQFLSRQPALRLYSRTVFKNLRLAVERDSSVTGYPRPPASSQRSFLAVSQSGPAGSAAAVTTSQTRVCLNVVGHSVLGLGGRLGRGKGEGMMSDHVPNTPVCSRWQTVALLLHQTSSSNGAED